ncbi:MAG: ABC transporter transmembrane domain-containing protein [Bacteroidota bacterium]
MANNRNQEVEELPENKKFSREKLREALGIYEYIRPYRWSIIGGLILLFLSSIVFMIFPYLMGKMIDIAQGEDVFNGMNLQQMGLVLIVVLVTQGFVSYARVMLFARVSESGIANVRKALYEKLITLPIVFYEKNRVGELVSRITADIEKLYDAFSIVLAEFLRQIIILVTGIVLLGITTPWLTLIMLSTFPVIVIGAIFFGRYIRRLSKERQTELAEANTILSETMQSISAVKSFTNEWFETRRFGSSIDQMVGVAMKFARGRAIFAVFIVTVLFGALFFIIWQAALMVQAGTITVGNLVSFVAYTAILGGAIAGLGNFYSQILGAIGATERVREILKMESEVAARAPRSQWSLKGNIVYRDVHFRYPTREDIPILKGVNLEIKAGQKVALVGPSGAGKSTLIQLLQQFYDLESGDILVDGKSIFGYDLTEYRRNIAVVPQEVLLFGGTIRENILYGNPNATEAEVIEAAKQSNSWEFIESFPEQLDTVVGERGVKLSGGQRQRVAIARAILRDPEILLLDEATSSLDAESERVVQDALNVLMQGRTSIIIAHRLSTIREVDCIYVIDKGKIIERGTHEELSAIDDGAYSGLAKLQFESI